MFAVLFIEVIRPIDDRANHMVAVGLKLRQILFVIDLFIAFPTADFSKRSVDGQTIEPSGKLGVALKRFCFAIDGPKDVLNHFLSVCRLTEDPERNIIEFDGVQLEDRFQDRKSTRLNSSHMSISYAV